MLKVNIPLGGEVMYRKIMDYLKKWKSFEHGKPTYFQVTVGKNIFHSGF